MSDYWQDRALPVLRALRDRDAPYGAAGVIMLGHGHDGNLGLDISARAIESTIWQLADAGYVQHGDVQHIGGGGTMFSDLRVTGRGLQVLGEWPRFEAMISPATLAALVDRLAEYAAPEEADQMRRAANAIRRLAATGLRSIAFGAGGQLLRHALGLP